MAREREPFWYCNLEDDGFGHHPADEDLVGRDEFGFRRSGCCLPEHCCMPGPHSPSECVSAETMEDPFAGASDEEGHPS